MTRSKYNQTYAYKCMPLERREASCINFNFGLEPRENLTLNPVELLVLPQALEFTSDATFYPTCLLRSTAFGLFESA